MYAQLNKIVYNICTCTNPTSNEYFSIMTALLKIPKFVTFTKKTKTKTNSPSRITYNWDATKSLQFYFIDILFN